MGRSNRSRKRRDEMNKIKRERYAVKELARLKKTLGLIDADGNEVMKEVAEVVSVKTAKQLKKEKQKREESEELAELLEEQDPGEIVEVVNEKTGKKHKYNTKTMKDENGTYPPWLKSRKFAKALRKKEFAKKIKFNQAWTVNNIAL